MIIHTENDDTSTTSDLSYVSVGSDSQYSGCEISSSSYSKFPKHLVPNTLSMTKKTQESAKISNNSQSVTATSKNDSSYLLESKIYIKKKGILKAPSIIENKEALTCRMQQWIESKRKKSVSFSFVQVQIYPIILGDNPACRMGAPISIGWEYEVLPLRGIDSYELSRKSSRRTDISRLVVSYYQRVQLLKRAGYGEEELERSKQKIARINRQRNFTVALQPFYKIELFAETSGRCLRNIMRGRQKRS